MTSFIAWIIVGGLAGWLAGVLTKGKGFGCLGNVVVGVIGSVVGGWLFGLIGSAPPGGGLIGSVITAVIGAVALILVVRLLTK
ncbi:MAG: GlsB/YeaQ/YmgE family stress response membrane protein [Anaerolineae bacterium]